MIRATRQEVIYQSSDNSILFMKEIGKLEQRIEELEKEVQQLKGGMKI